MKTIYPFEESKEYISVLAWGSDLPIGSVRVSEGKKFKDVPKGVTYKECQYDNVLDAFYSGFLGFCDCGNPEDEHKLMLRVLAQLFSRSLQSRAVPLGVDSRTLWARNTDELYLLFGKNDLFQDHYLKWLDSLGFLEHGGTVGGSWLDYKGISVLKMLIENRQRFIGD